jgi:hypothetical protein
LRPSAVVLAKVSADCSQFIEASAVIASALVVASAVIASVLLEIAVF